MRSTSPGACGDGLLAGRLEEEFRARSGKILVGQRVLQDARDGAGEGSAPGLLLEASVGDLNPNLIYMEGGLFADSRGSWKIPWPVLESWVERGSVLIVADCGTNEVTRHRSFYNHAARFLRARPEIPAGGNNGDAGSDSQIVCDTGHIVVSQWLRPALAGIPEIAFRHPAGVANWEHIAAGFTKDCETDAPASTTPGKEPWVLASAAPCGSGYIVLIAGEISADDWVERFPASAQWLTNLSELLVAEAERNSSKACSPVQHSFSFLLSGRSVNKQLVLRMGEALRYRGMQAWLDAELSSSGPSSIPPGSRGLDQATHFVLFWSRACLGAPWVERELSSAVSMAVERQVTMIVVRLDMAPLPKIITDFFRIEGLGMSPQEIAEASMNAARRIGRNRA